MAMTHSQMSVFRGAGDWPLASADLPSNPAPPLASQVIWVISPLQASILHLENESIPGSCFVRAEGEL